MNTTLPSTKFSDTLMEENALVGCELKLLAVNLSFLLRYLRYRLEKNFHVYRSPYPYKKYTKTF